ncbi:hypothetical protein Ciccas_005573 [Cichlidogyrus casuarinus]|uniref:Uncharacterized protein n=1 Tax=Cichlidogyrus casuarinus TaxID=1844966 RepID=A0ABD2Q8Q7_9PLAT
MLNRFEELVGTSAEHSDLADKLLTMFDRLTDEGGLSPEELTERKTQMASLINRMRDMKADLGMIMEKAEQTVENLEYLADTAREKLRAKNVKVVFEQTVEQDLETLPNDLESLKKLLSDREAMVARMAQEREASLQAMLQRGGVQAEQVDLIAPVDTELRANWAEVDRIAEASLASLRQATEAYEEFEDIRHKLSNLVAGSNYVVSGTSDVATLGTFVSAMGEGNIENYEELSELGIELDTSSLANYTIAGGLSGLISVSVESAAAAGLNAVKNQASAAKAQLDALLAAEEDLNILRMAAEKMKGRAATQRAVELNSTIEKLELEISHSRLNISDRLDKLHNAEVSWTELYSKLSSYEEFLQTQEDNLTDAVSVAPKANSEIEPSQSGATVAAAKAALQEVSMWSSTTKSHEAELNKSTVNLSEMQRILLDFVTLPGSEISGETFLDKLSNVKTTSREIMKVQTTIRSLESRKMALKSAFSTHLDSVNEVKGRIEHFLDLVDEFEPFLDQLETHAGQMVKSVAMVDSQKSLERFRNEHNNKMSLLSENWKAKQEALKEVASTISAWDCIKVGPLFDMANQT